MATLVVPAAAVSAVKGVDVKYVKQLALDASGVLTYRRSHAVFTIPDVGDVTSANCSYLQVEFKDWCLAQLVLESWLARHCIKFVVIPA